MAGGTFPVSVPSYPAISASETLGTMGGLVGHKATHDHEETDITALTAKVGIGAYTPAVGQVLACQTTTGTTLWAGGMVQLAKTVLGSPAATVDFTSISNGYSALMIQIMARGTVAATSDKILMRVGTAGSIDVGSNYDWADLYGTAVTATPGGAATEGALLASSVSVGDMTAASGPANEAGMSEIVIPNYATSTYYKRWRATANYRESTTTSSMYTENISGAWRNTAPINVIRFFCGANFATGSAFVLWGLG